MSPSNPQVSIITACYNSELFIAEAINSIINQTFKNWELIVVDDASKDATLQIINNFCLSHKKIKLIKNEINQGAAISRNKGIEAAIGDYIAFLDADDMWKPSKLHKQLEFMKSHNMDINFCSYDLINEKGEPLNKTVKALPVLTYKKLLKCNYIGNLTGIYNTKTLGKIYAPNLRKRQDWLLWLKAVKKTVNPVKSLPDSLALYRVRKNSMSSNKGNLIKYNYLVYKEGLGFSTIRSFYYMSLFLMEYIFVKTKQVVVSQEI